MWMHIGVLALQGAAAEHLLGLQAAGAHVVAVKRPAQLNGLQGLVIPGGESTTIGKLMWKYGFIEAICRFASQGKPIFGTCAGLICLAERIKGQHGEEEPYLKLMNMTVLRNAFGRQRESFEVNLDVKGIEYPVRAVFIRAPLIESVGKNVDVLCTFNEDIVMARQGTFLTCSFHPELTEDISLHRYFIDMVKQNQTRLGRGLREC